MSTLIQTLDLTPKAWFTFSFQENTGIGFTVDSTWTNASDLYVVENQKGQHRTQLLDYMKSLDSHEDLGRPGHKAVTKLKLGDVAILAPIPRPTSFRDGYAFRQHVESARKNRGLPMIPEFDEFPVFYFGNANGIIGPGVLEVQPAQAQELDFELEVGIVIGKNGKNIPVEKVIEHIAGFVVLNDWSARALQMQEMKLSLGPAKGKDFATAIGPALVPTAALKEQLAQTKNGFVLNAEMEARLNGERVSHGNVNSMTYSFSQIIERASDQVWIEAGDVIGSGTVGTGCFLELNTYPGAKKVWIKDGDQVDLTITGLGTLSHKIKFVEKKYET